LECWEVPVPPFFRILFYTVVGLALIALAWQAAAIVIDSPTRLPAMTVVLNRAIALAQSADYIRHATDSGTALLYGLLPAVIGGILLGMMADASAGIRLLVGPLAVTLGAAPLVALLPMFVAWWGLTMMMKAGLVGVAAGFPVMNAVMVAAGEKSRTVAILNGLRLGVVLGVSALTVTEFVAGSRGVGFVIMSSASMFDTTATLAGTMLVMVPTIAMAALLQAIEAQVGD
jgi:ABC-type nitrate/sulfonate/bicarbonate transport system permease component